jgi:hypothetical protein
MDDDASPGQMGSSGPANHPGDARKTGTVKVETGHLVRYQSRVGKVYGLKKVLGRCQIISEAFWIV